MTARYQIDGHGLTLLRKIDVQEHVVGNSSLIAKVGRTSLPTIEYANNARLIKSEAFFLNFLRW